MIENTRDRDPLTHLVGMVGGGDSYITGMEAAGQQQLVTSELLPTEGDWGEAERMGIIRGLVKDGDPLFTAATLPAGWRKVPTDHSMWSHVLDDRGVPRLSVFYKAAFYDRGATFHVLGVGAEIASKIRYSDGPVALPEYWERLTAAEKLSAAVELEDDAREAARNSNRFGDEDGRYATMFARCEAGLRLMAKADGL